MTTPIQIEWGDHTDSDLDQVCFQSMATNIVMGSLAQISGYDLEYMDEEDIESLRVEASVIVEHLATVGLLWSPSSYTDFTESYHQLTTYLGQNLDEVTE